MYVRIHIFVYLFLKRIFCIQSYRIRIFLNTDGTLKDSITPGQSGIESNDNKEVLHTSQISRIGASPSDAVKCHNQDTPIVAATQP